MAEPAKTGMTSKLILNMLGWKVEGKLPTIQKYIIIAAPHTSMLDFILGKFFLHSLSLDAKILMKKELFFFPMNFLLRKLGGIPVDRNQRNQTINKMVELFLQNEHFILAIAPEGTRKRVQSWRTGFYHIAFKAGVPILPAYCDYHRKVFGMYDLFYPTGEIDKDISILQSLFKNVTPFKRTGYNSW
jgi:1-acyl-sn-glycerol-3-phosphate acyltransferase